MQIDRDMNRGTGSVINAAGWQSYLNQIHTDAVLTGDREVYGSISRFNNQGAITNTTASDYQYWTNGAHNTAKMHPTATFDTDSTGILEIAITGTYGYAFADGGWTIYDTGGLSPANTVVASGVRSFVENSLTLDGTAAATVINAGFYVETVLGSTAGTSIGAGLYIPNGIITGSDTNYGVYDISDLPWLVEGAISTGGIFTVTPDGTNDMAFIIDIEKDELAGILARAARKDLFLTEKARRQLGIETFRKKVLPWAFREKQTLKTLDEMAQILYDTGIASSIKEGRDITPSLIGKSVQYGIGNEIGFDEISDGKDNKKYKIWYCWHGSPAP